MILASSANSTTVIVIGAIIIAALLIPIVGAWRGAGAELGGGVRELLDSNTRAQERVADELAQLTTRIDDMERLLKEVG